MSLYNNAYVIKSCNVLIFCEEFGRGFYKLKKKISWKIEAMKWNADCNIQREWETLLQNGFFRFSRGFWLGFLSFDWAFTATISIHENITLECWTAADFDFTEPLSSDLEAEAESGWEQLTSIQQAPAPSTRVLRWKTENAWFVAI